MNTGKLFPAHGLEDAVVDEVGLRPFDRLQDFVHLLSGTEPVVGHTLAFAPGAFPGTAVAVLFFDFGNEFHNCVVELKKYDYICNENPSGEVSLPLAQNLNLMTSLRSMMRVKNQTLIEIRGLIRLSGFHFSYSFQGFRIPLSSSLLTLQRYEKILNYANKIKCFLKKIITFLRKNLEDMGEFPIFATFKLSGGSKSQVSQPAIFMPVLYRNHTTVTASEGGNTPGALLDRLEQRVVRSFIYVQIMSSMNQTIQLGQVRPSVLSNVGRTVKNWKVWWSAKSEAMSEMIGEDCTHGEVVVTNLVFTIGVMAVAIAGTMIGG